jgi:hypothetical protein
MSQRLLKALGGVTAITVMTTLLGTAPAQAREADAQPRTIIVQARADGADHFTSSVSVAIPAGGTAQVTSPSLPKDMTKAKVEYEAPLSDAAGFNDLAMVLLQAPTPGKRLLTCITQATLRAIQDEAIAELTGTLDEYDAVAQTRFLVFLTMCVRIAALIAQVLAENARPAARLVGTPCGQAPIGVKTTVVKSAGQFSASTSNQPKAKPKSARVKVKCKVLSSTKVSVTVKPVKKGKSLRSVLGPNLGIGLASPASAEEGANVKVSFKAP